MNEEIRILKVGSCPSLQALMEPEVSLDAAQPQKKKGRK